MNRRTLLTLLVPAAMSLSGCGYNNIQQLDENAQRAQNDIEVQLARRSALIPNLVATVQRFAQQEQAVFQGVADARARLSGSIATHDPAQMAAANDQLSGALNRLLVISEAYPQLKSDQGFLQLQDELTGTENRIAVSRRDYNDAVNQYNSYIRRFPQAITARVIGSKPRTYFEASAAEQAVPTVNFAPPAPEGGASQSPPSTPAPAPAPPTQH